LPAVHASRLKRGGASTIVRRLGARPACAMWGVPFASNGRPVHASTPVPNSAATPLRMGRVQAAAAGAFKTPLVQVQVGEGQAGMHVYVCCCGWQPSCARAARAVAHMGCACGGYARCSSSVVEYTFCVPQFACQAVIAILPPPSRAGRATAKRQAQRRPPSDTGEEDDAPLEEVVLVQTGR
jgi:hypothetical protein